MGYKTCLRDGLKKGYRDEKRVCKGTVPVNQTVCSRF